MSRLTARDQAGVRRRVTSERAQRRTQSAMTTTGNIACTMMQSSAHMRQGALDGYASSLTARWRAERDCKGAEEAAHSRGSFRL